MSKKTIGQEIKAVVKLRKMSVEELASRLNVSKPNVFDIYRRTSIDTALLERLCEVLGYNFFEGFANRYRSLSPILKEAQESAAELSASGLSTPKEGPVPYQLQNEVLLQLVRESHHLYKALLKELKVARG